MKGLGVARIAAVLAALCVFGLGPGADGKAGIASGASAAVPAAVNLAPNPTFESDPGASYSTHGAAAFTWAVDASHSATHSLKVVSAQPSGALTRWLSKYSAIPVQAGKVYSASVWLRTVGVSQQANLSVNFWSASGGYLGETFDSQSLAGTKDWSLVSLQATAPPGAAFLRVEMRLWGPGTLWADDVTVVQGQLGLSTPNPDLEQNPAATYTTHGAAAFSWATDQAHSPTHSLKIVSSQPPGTLTRWMTLTSLIPAVLGETYALSAYLRTALAGGGTLAATFYNGSTYLPSASSSGISGTTDWTLQSVQVTAPAGATHLRVEFRLFGPGTLWADDLAVAVGGALPPPPAEPPVNTTPPAIIDQDPESVTQRTLNALPGVWTGKLPIAYSYQWQTCDLEFNVPDGCGDIPGATAQTFTVTVFPYNNGNYYRVVVTARNAAGAGLAGSPGFILGVSTANTGRPQITGTPVRGQALTSTFGSWVGLGRGGGGDIPFALRWQRCDTGGGNCTDIPGATATGRVGGAPTTHLLTPGDVGYRIRTVVVATRDDETATATAFSDPTATVTSPNLAPNPDLELSPATTYTTHGTATFTWATDQAHSPTHALKIVSAQAALARWMTVTSLIPVTPGKTYAVSAWLKTTAGTATLSATPYNGSYLPAASSQPLNGVNDWTKRSLQITIPTGVTHLRIEYRLNGPATLWADDLTVTES